MKNFKKIVAVFLTAFILSFTIGATLAAGQEECLCSPTKSDKQERENQSYFKSFTGRVKNIDQIRVSNSISPVGLVLLEDEEGRPANFIVSADTYLFNNAEIAVESVITAFYKANAPALMIFPPRYEAEIVTSAVIEGQNIKADLFDENLISADNSLKLNISDKTQIVSQDGQVFEGGLAGRKLIVLYNVSTRSIPAITTPVQIVVLFEKAVAPADPFDNQETSEMCPNVSAMDIVVNNKIIQVPPPYLNEQGVVMVPVRAIAEKLGYDVRWDESRKTVGVGKGISLTIGKDYYVYMRTAPISLGTAPALVDGKTYVPLSFFKEVVRMNNAYVFEGQIVIDNGETMR